MGHESLASPFAEEKPKEQQLWARGRPCHSHTASIPPRCCGLMQGAGSQGMGGKGSVPQRAVLMPRVRQRGTPARGSGASCPGALQRNTVSAQLSTHLPGGTCGQCTVPTAVGGQVSPGGCSQSSDAMVPRGGRPGLRPRCPHTQLGRTSCWGTGQSPRSEPDTHAGLRRLQGSPSGKEFGRHPHWVGGVAAMPPCADV